jgi:hypothetical protein
MKKFILLFILSNEIKGDGLLEIVKKIKKM